MEPPPAAGLDLFQDVGLRLARRRPLVEEAVGPALGSMEQAGAAAPGGPARIFLVRAVPAVEPEAGRAAPPTPSATPPGRRRAGPAGRGTRRPPPRSAPPLGHRQLAERPEEIGRPRLRGVAGVVHVLGAGAVARGRGWPSPGSRWPAEVGVTSTW